MAEIVHKNVDQTASLDATGLMEFVNLAAHFLEFSKLVPPGYKCVHDRKYPFFILFFELY